MRIKKFNGVFLPSFVVASTIVSIFIVLISITIVGATTFSHLDKMQVKANTYTVLTVTVNNAGASPIDNVRIILPSGFSNFAPLDNRPENWTHTTGITDPISPVPAVEWNGISDNRIYPGESLSFPFALTTPGPGTSAIFVRTPTYIEWLTLIVENNQHAPIYIDGNGGFIKPDPVNGGGSGTENDPYIIENWEISAENANGIDIRNTTAYFLLTNCKVHDGWINLKHGIFLYNVVNGKIDNVTSEYNGEGIELNHSNRDSLINSNISHNDNVNLNIYCSDNNLISNCSMSKTYIGLSLENSSNDEISNCTVQDHGDGGMYVVHQSHNNIISSNVLENNISGINLSWSNNNFVSSNTVENSTQGICLSWADNNLIFGNTVENNYDGLYIDGIPPYSSDNNFIYHNTIVNNTNQAHDSGSNYWDNGYTSGGNYWSDYTGFDNYHGENTNIAGGEGIGDMPYYILGGSNQDHYPLMNPWPTVIENYSDIHLSAGLNLVGFATENTPNNVFSGLTYLTDYIIYWYKIGAGYQVQGLTAPFNDNSAYWVWVKENRTVGTRATHLVSENVNLVVGWNLVHFPIVNENTTPANIFPGLVYLTDYVIYSYNFGAGYLLQSATRPLNDSAGYWVWIDQDMTVTVPGAIFQDHFNTFDENVWFANFGRPGYPMDPSLGTAYAANSVLYLRPSYYRGGVDIQTRQQIITTLPVTIKFRIMFEGNEYRNPYFVLDSVFEEGVYGNNPRIEWNLGTTNHIFHPFDQFISAYGPDNSQVESDRAFEVIPVDTWLDGELRLYDNGVETSFNGVNLVLNSDVKSIMTFAGGLTLLFFQGDDYGQQGLDLDWVSVEAGT